MLQPLSPQAIISLAMFFENSFFRILIAPDTDLFWLDMDSASGLLLVCLRILLGETSTMQQLNTHLRSFLT